MRAGAMLSSTSGEVAGLMVWSARRRELEAVPDTLRPLLNRHAFRQIARLIHVAAPPHRNVVGQ